MSLGDRFNYYLVKGPAHPANRFDHRVFMTGLWSVSNDLVRAATLELISREIHRENVAGAVAELGVYQGDFARLINAHFADRTLYLFDTFTGFAEMDLAMDTEKNYVETLDDFSKTDPYLVKSLMPHPERVEIHAGHFPASAAGCEDALFSFVSLDVDLYEPTLEGLRWFSTRLSPGGYIMVHDYNHDRYKGVREAVRQFIADTGASLCPLPDTGGSAVIAKPRT